MIRSAQEIKSAKDARYNGNIDMLDIAVGSAKEAGYEVHRMQLRR